MGFAQVGRELRFGWGEFWIASSSPAVHMQLFTRTSHCSHLTAERSDKASCTACPAGLYRRELSRIRCCSCWDPAAQPFTDAPLTPPQQPDLNAVQTDQRISGPSSVMQANTSRQWSDRRVMIVQRACRGGHENPDPWWRTCVLRIEGEGQWTFFRAHRRLLWGRSEAAKLQRVCCGQVLQFNRRRGGGRCVH